MLAHCIRQCNHAGLKIQSITETKSDWNTRACVCGGWGVLQLRNYIPKVLRQRLGKVFLGTERAKWHSRGHLTIIAGLWPPTHNLAMFVWLMNFAAVGEFFEIANCLVSWRERGRVQHHWNLQWIIFHGNQIGRNITGHPGDHLEPAHCSRLPIEV